MEFSYFFTWYLLYLCIYIQSPSDVASAFLCYLHTYIAQCSSGRHMYIVHMVTTQGKYDNNRTVYPGNTFHVSPPPPPLPICLE